MTINEIRNEIARIACMVYDGATAMDIKEELDALWEKSGEPRQTYEENRQTMEKVRTIIDEISYDVIDDLILGVEKKLQVELTLEECCIDDGCDEEDELGDTYVMKSRYSFKYNDIEFQLRIYYGDNSEKVGYYSLGLE